MPLYEYQCEACGERFEVIQKFSDPPVEKCSVCGGGPVRQLLSSPAIQFKGSGWYITDYSRKGKTGDTSETSKSDTNKNAKSADASSTSTTKSESTAASPSSSGSSTTKE